MIDLRSTEERASDTNARLTAAGLGYWARGYAFSHGNIVTLMRNPANHAPAAARRIMLDAYRNFPREHAPGYRQLTVRRNYLVFYRLLPEDQPALIDVAAVVHARRQWP